jgi:hypothetical protein
MDRLERLPLLAASWLANERGSSSEVHAFISAAVYVSASANQSDGGGTTWQMRLKELRERHVLLRKYAYIHVIVAEEEEEEYPINQLRNLAMMHVPTDWVIVLDIDFIPGPPGIGRLLGMEDSACRDRIHNARSNRVAFVLPAFAVLPQPPERRIRRQGNKQYHGVDPDGDDDAWRLPTSRHSVRDMVRAGQLEPFRTHATTLPCVHVN